MNANSIERARGRPTVPNPSTTARDAPPFAIDARARHHPTVVRHTVVGRTSVSARLVITIFIIVVPSSSRLDDARATTTTTGRRRDDGALVHRVASHRIASIIASNPSHLVFTKVSSSLDGVTTRTSTFTGRCRVASRGAFLGFRVSSLENPSIQYRYSVRCGPLSEDLCVKEGVVGRSSSTTSSPRCGAYP